MDVSRSSSTSVATTSDPPSVRAWMAAIIVFGAYELFTYFAGFGSDRHAFPTLSSLYDSATSNQAAKAVIVLGWMALGWGLFRPRTVRTDGEGHRPR